MDTEKRGQELTLEEEQEFRDGSALYEMTQGLGWQVVKRILENLAYHSWTDPRGMNKEEWEFAELNSFHAANNAKELLETMERLISRADALGKIKSGETKRRNMRF